MFSMTGALRNRITPALVVLPVKKGRAVYTSKAKSTIPPIQWLYNLRIDVLAKSLKGTLDNRPTLQNIRKIAASFQEGYQGTRAVRDLECGLHCFL